MSEVFITKIHINKVRHLENFEIPLSEDSKKHLIITGKNGSGKTSVLEEIRNFLSYLQRLVGSNKKYPDLLKPTLRSLGEAKYRNKYDIGVNVVFNGSLYAIGDMFNSKEYIDDYLGSKRPVNNFHIPPGPHAIDFNKEDIGRYFLQYLVNQKTDRSFARDEGEPEKAEQIDKWFKKFEESLREIFHDEDLKLKFDYRNNYSFSIIQPNREPFGFNEMSDGYSAFVNILAELIMRMAKHSTNGRDLQGVVLIDEIEAHLHVELQKRVLPFLTSFFPNIQFIVTTHSPFVLSSIEDCVICDLENRTVAEDFSGYSYGAIIETHFNHDEYSQALKDKITRYKKLSAMQELSDDEEDELLDLEYYLESLPKFLSPELEFQVNKLLADK